MNRQFGIILVVMSGESESILGEIPVIARLALGNERLTLFVTGARIIVAHVGKRGTGAIATSTLLGRFGGGLEDVLKRGRESRGKRALKRSTLDSILAADKDNFDLRYDEIVSVQVVETAFSRIIIIVTRDDKFDFRSSLSLDRIVALLENNLGPKLTIERI